MKRNGRTIATSGDEPISMHRRRFPGMPTIESLIKLAPAVLEVRIKPIKDMEYLKELNWRAYAARKRVASEVIVEHIKSLK